MTLDDLERLAREAKEEQARQTIVSGFATCSVSLIPSLADAVLRLVAVARAAERLQLTPSSPGPDADLFNALSALAKSEGGG